MTHHFDKIFIRSYTKKNSDNNSAIMNYYLIKSDKYLISSYTIKIHLRQKVHRVRPDKISHNKDFWSASYQLLKATYLHWKNTCTVWTKKYAAFFNRQKGKPFKTFQNEKCSTIWKIQTQQSHTYTDTTNISNKNSSTNYKDRHQIKTFCKFFCQLVNTQDSFLFI